MLQIVMDCVKILLVEASKRDIPIVIDSNPPFSEAMSEYMGDPNRIKQILMNFLSNAVKFTAKGHIEVNVRITPLVEGKESPNGSGVVFGWQDLDEIRIEVKDTGIGISDTSKLFAPFVQAALSTSRMYGGTGLGLSICKQLADIMGGEVTPSSASVCLSLLISHRLA
jgi:signal transduction histidine kinase